MIVDASPLRAELLQKAATLRSSLHDILLAINRLAPISFMPREILSHIFELYARATSRTHGERYISAVGQECRRDKVGSRYWSLLSLSHVCEAWRELVMNTMLLWATMDVAELAEASKRFPRGTLPFPTTCSLAVNLAFGRDFQCPCVDTVDYTEDTFSFCRRLDSNEQSTDCLTSSITSFSVHILPVCSNITELTIELPNSAISHLFAISLPQCGILLSSLTSLTINFESNEPVTPRLIEAYDQATRTPIQLLALRSLTLGQASSSDASHLLLRLLHAPYAECRLSVIEPGLQDFLLQLGKPSIQTRTTYAVKYPDRQWKYHFAVSLVPRHSTITTPLFNVYMVTFVGFVSHMGRVLSMFEGCRNSAFTEGDFSIPALFFKECSVDFHSKETEDIIDRISRSLEGLASVTHIIEKLRKPTYNADVNIFIKSWWSLLAALPELKSLHLRGLTGEEAVYLRSSLVMPLLLPITPFTTHDDDNTDDSSAPQIRATQLKNLYIHYDAKTYCDNTAAETTHIPSNPLSWLDDAIISRREHLIPIKTLTIEIENLPYLRNQFGVHVSEAYREEFIREASRIEQLGGGELEVIRLF